MSVNLNNITKVHTVESMDKFPGQYRVTCEYEGNPAYVFMATQEEYDTLQATHFDPEDGDDVALYHDPKGKRAKQAVSTGHAERKAAKMKAKADAKEAAAKAEAEAAKKPKPKPKK